MAAEEYEKLSNSEKKKEDWMNSKWRPMMGWMYMIVCTMDFVVFPVLWGILQAVVKTTQITQWNPLTLQGAGLFHLAMGAVLGVSAWSRGQEKMAGANTMPSSPTVSAPVPVSTVAVQPQTVQPSISGNTQEPQWVPQPALTASGKKIVPQEPFPVI